MKAALSLWITKAWYRNAPWLKLLYPFSLLFAFLGSRRRKHFLASPDNSFRAGACIMVVGNITAGGTGKTPLTLALAQKLQQHGVDIAIVSRGYGGHSKRYPLEVSNDMSPAECGDEALIYAARAGCPVVVDPDRVRAVQYLEARYQSKLILCDDGLQHYTLARDVELALIDGQRGLGNQQLLPCGPLREPPQRLNEVDFVLINGAQQSPLPQLTVPVYSFSLQATMLYNLQSGVAVSCAEFRQRFPGKVNAAAGIGNPERFFSTLTAQGFAIITHVFTDHHRFTAANLDFGNSLPIVMTEKDAVKCRSFCHDFAEDTLWYLSVDAQLPAGLLPQLLEALVTKRLASPFQ